MKLKTNKKFYTIHSAILILLFLAGHLIQVNTSIENGKVVLPTFLVSISKIIFVLFMLYSMILFFFYYKNKITLLLDHNLIVLFFGVQCLYSIATFTDVWRYLTLVLVYFFIPLSIKFILQNSSFHALHKSLVIFIFLYFSISIFPNLNTLFAGDRYQGLLYNANLYGFVCVFWISILLINPDLSFKKNFFKIFFIFLIFITLFLSGSRTSLFSAIIVLFITYIKYLRKILIPLIILTGIIYFLTMYLDLDFILDRFLHSNDMVNESGRSTYWNKAINYIEIEPWWGYGMDAPANLVNTNIHNNYLRYLFTMGRVFSFLTFVPLAIFLYRLFFRWYNKIPKSLIGYFCAFLVANLGEDYFIGIISTSAIFTLINLGMIYYFITRSQNIIRNENFTN